MSYSRGGAGRQACNAGGPAGRTACQYRRIVYTLYRAHRLHFATFLR